MEKQALVKLAREIENLPKGSTAQVVGMLPATGSFTDDRRAKILSLLSIKERLEAAKKQGKSDLEIKLDNHRKYLADAKTAGNAEDITFYSRKVRTLEQQVAKEQESTADIESLFVQAIDTGELDKADILIKAIGKRVTNELVFQWKKEIGLVDNPELESTLKAELKKAEKAS